MTISGDENGGGKLHHADGDQWFWRSPNQVLYFHISIVDGPMLDAWNKSDTVDGEWHERAFAPEDLEIGHWWDDSLGHTWSSFDMHWGNPDEPYWKNDTATVHINLQPANSDSPFDGWDGQLEEDPGITDLNGNGIPDRMEPDPNNPNPPPPDPTDITDPNNPIGNYDPSDDPIESQTGDGGGEIGDQVSLEGHNGSVDIHGVPIPEPSPTGEGESDRLPNMAKIDAFSLSPSFSTTDVGVPMPGDELLMEFRRTLSTGLDVYHPFSTAPNIDKHFAGETILGSAWRTNIGSHVTISFNPSPAPGEPGYRATVYDEIGNPISYYSNDDAVYKSDVRSSFTNMALRAKLG